MSAEAPATLDSLAPNADPVTTAEPEDDPFGNPVPQVDEPEDPPEPGE